MEKENKKRYIGLYGGACGYRLYCENLDKSFCRLYPRDGEDFLECNHFKFKKELDKKE